MRSGRAWRSNKSVPSTNSVPRVVDHSHLQHSEIRLSYLHCPSLHYLSQPGYRTRASSINSVECGMWNVEILLALTDVQMLKDVYLLGLSAYKLTAHGYWIRPSFPPDATFVLKDLISDYFDYYSRAQ